MRHGTAKVLLAGRRHDVTAGDVVSVPRTTSYEIAPAAGRFEYVAVRIFSTGRPTRIGIGAAWEPHPMPDVAAKAQIDGTLASADKNVLLHSAGAVLINHVIYKSAPVPGRGIVPATTSTLCGWELRWLRSMGPSSMARKIRPARSAEAA